MVSRQARAAAGIPHLTYESRIARTALEQSSAPVGLVGELTSGRNPTLLRPLKRRLVKKVVEPESSHVEDSWRKVPSST